MGHLNGIKKSPFIALSSLYRRSLRQVRRFPDVYVQYFFRLKLADDARRILATEDPIRFKQRVTRFSKELRKVEAANKGNVKAFGHILDLAYGRKGKLRWELMEPLLSDPSAPTPPPIIKGKPDSRPPVYSRELSALLTSPHSRTTKPLQKSALTSPPALPARANLSSDEVQLLGPFSKRREVNIRWRFFTEEWKKVLPPLQLICTEAKDNQLHNSSDKESLARIGVRPVGMQDSGVMEHIERMASPPATKMLTRRERLASGKPPPPSAPFMKNSRWIRRRYQQLSGRLPILTHHRSKERPAGSFDVMLPKHAISPSQRRGTRGLAEADEVDLTWLRDEKIQDLKNHVIEE